MHPITAQAFCDELLKIAAPTMSEQDIARARRRGAVTGATIGGILGAIPAQYIPHPAAYAIPVATGLAGAALGAKSMEGWARAPQRWEEYQRKLREEPGFAEYMGDEPEPVTKTAMTDEDKAKFKGYAAGVGGATLGAGIGIGTALGLEKIIGDALGKERSMALARGAYRYGVPAGLSALGAQLAHNAYKERQKVQQKWLDELREQQRMQDDTGGLPAS